jgi:hypothetical protein
MTTCMCGNEFSARMSAGRIRCYTCSAMQSRHTASQRELVAAMWDVLPRLSCAEIGRRMVPEMSKSAVIGIAHRMGLSVRTPANARWGPGKSRPPRRLRAHVPFGAALPSGAVALPVLASAMVAAARKPPVPPAKPPQRAPEPPAVPPVSPPRPRAPWPVADDGGRRDGCQWIEGKPWRYCGAPVSGPGSAWCKEHRARVYIRRSSFNATEREGTAA